MVLLLTLSVSAQNPSSFWKTILPIIDLPASQQALGITTGQVSFATLLLVSNNIYTNLAAQIAAVGITAAQATNIAAYQAYLATNNLAAGAYQPGVSNYGEMWFAPSGSVAGNGSASFPFITTSPAAFSNYLASETRTNITWRFYPGTYVIPYPGIVPLAGWKFRGSGQEGTTVMFATNVSPSTASAVFITRTPSHVNGVEISDMTIDCNMGHQTNIQQIAAVYLIGSYCRVERVKAINWGTRAGELFLFAIRNNLIDTNYYSIFDSCRVGPSALITNWDGVTAFSMHVDGPGQSAYGKGLIIQNCYVQGITCGTNVVGQPAYFHAYSDGSGGVTRNNFAYDLDSGGVGVYQESYNGRDSVAQGNIIDNVFRGFEFNLSGTRQGIAWMNNVVRVPSSGVGLYQLNGGGSASEFAIVGNVVYPTWDAFAATPLSIDPTTSSAAQVANVLNGNNGQHDFDIYSGKNMVANANFSNAIPQLSATYLTLVLSNGSVLSTNGVSVGSKAVTLNFTNEVVNQFTSP